MPIWKKPQSGTLKIGILLFDSFSNHCLANAIEPLRAANDLSGQALFHWQFLSLDGAPLCSSSGLTIHPEGAVTQASGDHLFVMPSYAYHTHTNAPTLAALRGAARRFETITGYDTGAWLMASAGLLDGYRATIHWEELDAFAESFDQVDAIRSRFIIDRDRVTCSGAMAAFDLSMRYIADRKGEALRQQVATLFMSDERAQGTPGRQQDRVVAKAVAQMQAHIETPLSLADLASKIGLSQRKLETHMKDTLGATPRAVYRRERMIVARKLVRETELGIAEIAVRCGYQDATAFTRAFKAEFGASPRETRSI